jgi:hypothetical protein
LRPALVRFGREIDRSKGIWRGINGVIRFHCSQRTGKFAVTTKETAGMLALGILTP